jgi:hypothetical protein
MKKILANMLALAGGAWTGLCGTLLMGLLLSLAQDPFGLSPNSASFYGPQMAAVAALTMVGVVMLWAGLRLMKNAATLPADPR